VRIKGREREGLATVLDRRRTNQKGDPNALVKTSERVASGDFSSDEEVRLADLSRALSGVSRPGSAPLDGELGRLVDSDAVDVERLDGEAREDLNLGHDLGRPLSESILDRGELGELSLPIGAERKGFERKGGQAQGKLRSDPE
jgi:hypothetical protein